MGRNRESVGTGATLRNESRGSTLGCLGSRYALFQKRFVIWPRTWLTSFLSIGPPT
jgi:hypothetical protein